MVKLPALLQGLLRRAHAGAQSQAGSRAGPRSPHRKTMIFESLEPRLLLSDTPLAAPSFAPAGIINVSAPLTSGDIKVETVYQSGVPVLRVWDNVAGSALAQLTFNQNIRVNIQGRDYLNDLITVDLGYDDGVAGTSPLTSYALMVDFNGGADLPLLTDDSLRVLSSGPDFYAATSLFLNSTDDIQIDSAVQVTDKLNLASEEAIAVNGVALTAADMYLGVTKAITDGVTLIDGLNLLGNASGSITLAGATLQAASSLPPVSTWTRRMPATPVTCSRSPPRRPSRMPPSR